VSTLFSSEGEGRGGRRREKERKSEREERKREREKERKREREKETVQVEEKEEKEERQEAIHHDHGDDVVQNAVLISLTLTRLHAAVCTFLPHTYSNMNHRGTGRPSTLQICSASEATGGTA